jgi:NTE family protein
MWNTRLGFRKSINDENPTVDNASYFEKLVGSVTKIARHCYFPGKEDAIKLCLQEVEELKLSGRITAEQEATLRRLLLGEEPLNVLAGDFPERDRFKETTSPSRIAIACQGDGSHAAFTAGVLQGLLEQKGDDETITALSGTSCGAVCALLAWNGLLQGDPRKAVDQLQRFWQDYTATCLIDAFLNYSAQTALYLRSVIAFPFPGFSPYAFPSLSQDQLRKMLERRVDFAEARSLSVKPVAPGLIVGSVDVQNGAFQVFHGRQINADLILASAAIPHLFPAVPLDDRSSEEGLLFQNPPIRELTDFSPDEIWVIQINKFDHKRVARTASDFSDHYELTGNLLLEQELRFIQKINGLLDRGVLIGSGYRHIDVHRIIMEHDLDYSSKFDRSPSFIYRMMAYGRERAKQFWDKRRCGLSRRSPTHLMK